MLNQEGLPFVNCLSVNIDLCVMGVEAAMGIWLKNFDSRPTVLWCHPTKIALADKVAVGTDFAILADPNYQENWWSIGTRLNRGFGSIGAG